MLYEKLYREAEQHRIDIYEKPMSPRNKGFYADSIIWINKGIPTRAEKACILAEELGHYHTSVGDITDQTDLRHRKQECRARQWAYETLVPLEKIVQAHHARVSNRYEFAQYLGVTETFLQSAIERYREKYGLYKKVGRYVIHFDPLGVAEKFE